MIYPEGPPGASPISAHPQTGRKPAVSREFGRRFGRYETLFRIAGGGMAEVYAARILGEGGFQKVVALKRMLPTLAEDERFVTMFLDEGRVAANIASPNVVQTLDLGRADDDSLYLVMELVVGVSLGRLVRGALKEGKYLDVPIAAKLVAEAARGLHDAHEATTPMGEPLHIIHRDVSPQNILVDRAGRTRITDFGVARAMQRHSHTQTGEMKGKMAYFAPEQAVGGDLDRRLDVFALGIVAWEVFSGRRLFKGENPLQTLKKITEAPVPSLRRFRPEIPEAVDAAILKALERDREQRWPTALAFARALEAAVETPATTADIGEAVKAFGGAPLDDLDLNLKRALSGEISAMGQTIEPGVDDSPTVMERTPLSTSAILPSQVSSSGAAPITGATGLVGQPEKRSLVLPLALGAVVALAAGVGAFFALQGGTTPTTVEPAAAPAATTGAVPPLAPPSDPEPQAAAAPVAEPEAVVDTEELGTEEAPEEVEETAPASSRRRRTRRAPSGTTTTATATAMTTETASTTMASPMVASPMTSATTASPMTETTMSGSSSSMLLLGWDE